ncbi:CueP family metal-binding protein [Planococcus versutus]|uniref:Lipoprotein n=1 Tax=Planococcus versutus TaxID=1302659 RepID=A0A1B1S5M4_9BACL|nr:CueP family metal-binding protein [Planococcus versutus]ANU28496.1 hypothetical protein I858_016025 [Planococcus versutus]
MKLKSFVMAIGLLAILSGCSTTSEESSEKEVKERVTELSASQLVDSASIDDKKLIIEDKGEKTSYALPEEDFFVSVAPYETYTHPCEVHSLTGCQGELTEKEMNVTITDAEGNVHVDDVVPTLENGFMDFWLPRNETYVIKVEYEGKKTEYEFSTFEGDSTCLTELALT